MRARVVVIPSRRRPNAVPRMRQMFPEAYWCLDAVDAKQYDVPKAKRLIQPPHTVGLPRTRQWLLDTLTEETLCMLDDDVSWLFVNCGKVGRRIREPRFLEAVIDNANRIAKDLGTSLFGFAKHGDVRKFHPPTPFLCATWVAGFMGIIGRKHRFNTALTSRGDMDFALRVLERDRFVWVDARFSFVYDSFRRPGGMTLTRTAESDQQDMRRLKREWGPWIDFRATKTGLTPALTVQRRQSLQQRWD